MEDPKQFYHPSYIELKFNRPESKLKDGRVITNCFANGGVVYGKDPKTGDYVEIPYDQVVGITKGKGLI